MVPVAAWRLLPRARQAGGRAGRQAGRRAGGQAGHALQPKLKKLPMCVSAAGGARLVMNTVITGASFAELDSLVKQIRSKPGSIWNKTQFGMMHPEDGHGARLIPLRTFLSPCEGKESCATLLPLTFLPGLQLLPQLNSFHPRSINAAPVLTTANAWGPTTGQATAAAGAESQVTFKQVG